MNPTSDTAIITAAPVVAVRRGFRAAFSRDMLPTMPRNFVSGTPMVRASWRANSGETTNTPTSISSAPMPTSEMPLPPNRPANRDAMPRARITPVTMAINIHAVRLIFCISRWSLDQ